MTIKLFSVFSVTLSIILISSIFFHFSAALGGKAGGWTPLNDVNAPDVIAIGQFAVDEHNKEAGTKLKFQSIVKGESQVVAGTNYRLVIKAKDGGYVRKYLVVVWDKPWEKFKKLTSFKQM
ncbi:cysteine proteinase inhibitor 1 [Solanum dulcamara]|uniref:cysteine proteinase inhibitor 1 n=1 Tax=Solanum dulcamara TaxID=45834 RepID=UPI002485B0B1|nr:cysteine proteinase inhibitor 1 [Solanum dulcamara]